MNTKGLKVSRMCPKKFLAFALAGTLGLAGLAGVSAADTAYAANNGGSSLSGATLTTQAVSKVKLSAISLSQSSFIYTGSEIKPSVTVTGADGSTLYEGSDYTLTYTNNTKAGTATVKATGVGNYTGSVSGKFTIEKVDLSNASVSGVGNAAYTGSSVKPIPTVSVGGRTLISGTDYTVSYTNNSKPGTATMTIKGKNNYSGQKSVNFTISEGAHPGLTVTATSPAAKSYSDKAYQAAGTVKVVGKKGTVTYKNTSSGDAAKFQVNASNGKVTVPAKMAPGTYNVKITATDDGGANFSSASGVATMTIKITGDAKNSSFKATAITPNPVKYSTKAQVVSKVVRVEGAGGKVTYKNVATTQALLKFKVNGTSGAITVPAKTPVGTYTIPIQVTDKGGSNYASSTKTVSVKVTVAQGTQSIKVTAKGKTLKVSNLKKKAATAGTVKVTNSTGKVTYGISGSKYFSISSKGAVTAQKGTPKGTYNLKVKATAAGNSNVKSDSATATMKVVVK